MSSKPQQEGGVSHLAFKALAMGAVAALVYIAFVSLVKLLVWSIVALLAGSVSIAIVIAQAALYAIVTARFGSRVTRSFRIAPLGLRLKVGLSLGVAVVFAAGIFGLEALVPGVIGKVFLPGLAIAEVVTLWLTGSWALQIPSILGWHPKLGIFVPAVPWSHPWFLGIASVPWLLDCLDLLLSKLTQLPLFDSRTDEGQAATRRRRTWR